MNIGFTYLQEQDQTEFVKVFFISLSTELPEGKQRFKLGGVDTSLNVSTFPNTFALFLDSNLHDLNETNRTDAVFSRTVMVLFIVQKTKVLGMT